MTYYMVKSKDRERNPRRRLSNTKHYLIHVVTDVDVIK